MSSSGGSFSSAVPGNVVKNRDNGIGFKRINCWCGAVCLIRTSNTSKNPGRLFYSCSNGSGDGKNHMFKWVDELMVQEIEELNSIISVVKEDVRKLSMEVEFRSCGRCETEVGAVKAIVVEMENELEKVKKESQNFKNLCMFGFLICGVCIYATRG